ncbi:hypothetical protein CDD80_1311 [Ophiocordyceps camponoti-rufipedis]|uniref:Uncharacterized protein n=1 Tax=Ophiocordyceps camponoti-rufipedis TaxID=2004952 RepID=A0A2C5ZBD2_9HYPO|nr:hypothetical protein CDD80_1311 [Ophiocordyceps camponoti-rufipedis]
MLFISAKYYEQYCALAFFPPPLLLLSSPLLSSSPPPVFSSRLPLLYIPLPLRRSFSSSSPSPLPIMANDRPSSSSPSTLAQLASLGTTRAQIAVSSADDGRRRHASCVIVVYLCARVIFYSIQLVTSFTCARQRLASGRKNIEPRPPGSRRDALISHIFVSTSRPRTPQETLRYGNNRHLGYLPTMRARLRPRTKSKTKTMLPSAINSQLISS